MHSLGFRGYDVNHAVFKTIDNLMDEMPIQGFRATEPSLELRGFKA